MKDILHNMSQQEFDTLIESEITLKRTEDTQLEDEASKHWKEVVGQTYLFDRLEKEIAVLKTLTLTQLQDWFTEEYLGDNQRKISFQIQIIQHTMQWGLDLHCLLLVTGTHVSDTSKLPGETDHRIKCLIDSDQTQSLAIEDIQSVRKLWNQLPLTNVVS